MKPDSELDVSESYKKGQAPVARLPVLMRSSSIHAAWFDTSIWPCCCKFQQLRICDVVAASDCALLHTRVSSIRKANGTMMSRRQNPDSHFMQLGPPMLNTLSCSTIHGTTIERRIGTQKRGRLLKSGHPCGIIAEIQKHMRKMMASTMLMRRKYFRTAGSSWRGTRASAMCSSAELIA